MKLLVGLILVLLPGLAAAQSGQVCESQYQSCIEACLRKGEDCAERCQGALRNCLNQAAAANRQFTPAQRQSWVEGQLQTVRQRVEQRTQSLKLQTKQLEAAKTKDKAAPEPTKPAFPKIEPAKTEQAAPAPPKPIAPPAKEDSAGKSKR